MMDEKALRISETFYSDFLSLLERGVNPFTMEAENGYHYLKAIHTPKAKDGIHPDFLASIQMNIYANKTGKAHISEKEMEKIGVFTEENQLLSDESLHSTEDYLSKLQENAGITAKGSNPDKVLALSEKAISSLPIDFSIFSDDEDRIRKLTVIILAYSLLYDSLYFQEKAVPAAIAMSSYLSAFPSDFRSAASLKRIFTQTFDFPLWKEVLDSAHLFTQLNDRNPEQHSKREEIIDRLGKIHVRDIKDRGSFPSPPKITDIDVPKITILNSFIPGLRDGTVFTLSEAEKRFQQISSHIRNDNVESRLDARITYSVSYDRNGAKETVTVPESSPMDLCREPRIPQHLDSLVSKGIIADQGFPAFITKHLGLCSLEENLKKEVIPAIESLAERRDYTSYAKAYLSSSRKLLNKHHDMDIAAPLDTKNYRTSKSLRTTKRRPKESETKSEESNDRDDSHRRTRDRQERRKRRFR